jgi:hypothetical protein
LAVGGVAVVDVDRGAGPRPGCSSRFGWRVARPVVSRPRNVLKSYEEIMEILEAFDLTGSFRAAGALAGCSHHTVEHYVALRDEGRLVAVGELPQRRKLIDPYLAKIEEWVVPFERPDPG